MLRWIDIFLGIGFSGAWYCIIEWKIEGEMAIMENAMPKFPPICLAVLKSAKSGYFRLWGMGLPKTDKLMQVEGWLENEKWAWQVFPFTSKTRGSSLLIRYPKCWKDWRYVHILSCWRSLLRMTNFDAHGYKTNNSSVYSSYLSLHCNLC